MPGYETALPASGGRVAVRDWLDTTVGERKRHLARYFLLQRPQSSVMALKGSRSEFYDLAAAILRNVNKELPTPMLEEHCCMSAAGEGPLAIMAVVSGHQTQTV